MRSSEDEAWPVVARVPAFIPVPLIAHFFRRGTFPEDSRQRKCGLIGLIG
jgi:hypothetical protein